MPGANECTAQIVLIHRSWDKGSRENNQCPDFHNYPRVYKVPTQRKTTLGF